MILPLRRVHRVVFAVLAPGLPALLVAGLLVRDGPATVERLPGGLVGERSSFEGEWNHPDALLYGSERSAAPGDPLPADARLVGSVHEGSVSATDLPTAGHLIVYSLATQEVVASYPAAERRRR